MRSYAFSLFDSRGLRGLHQPHPFSASPLRRRSATTAGVFFSSRCGHGLTNKEPWRVKKWTRISHCRWYNCDRWKIYDLKWLE